MKKLSGLLLLGGVLLTGTLAFATNEGNDACDLKTVEDGLYCPDCDEILEGDAIAKKEYCADCYEIAVSEEEKPQKATKVKVCVKTCYACPDCGEESRAAGDCPECEVELEKAVNKARVLFACEECGKEFEKAGKCDEEDCSEMKSKVVRTCASSGAFPHVK